MKSSQKRMAWAGAFLGVAGWLGFGGLGLGRSADAGNPAARPVRVPELESVPQELAVADEAMLRLAMARGETVRLSFDGTLSLTRPLLVEKDTVLDASGHQVTLSGARQVRVLEVRTNVHLTLRGLTLADGRSSDGAGLLNAGGVVTLLDCTFTNHQAVGAEGIDGPNLGEGLDELGPAAIAGGAGWPARGGAILSSGTLIASNCVFVANQAVAGRGGDGGRIPARATESQPWNPRQYSGGLQGSGGAGASANGGAIYQESGYGRLVNCTFARNAARAGRGGSTPISLAAVAGDAAAGGHAQGGAVFVQGGRLELLRSDLIGNEAIGGPGGAAGEISLLVAGQRIGAAGAGGEAQGGAVFAQGTGEIRSCRFGENRAGGGSGGKGGTFDGQHYWQSIQSPDCTGLQVGAGGAGGHGEGAGLWTDGALELEANSWIANLAEGGNGGDGGAGTVQSWGGFAVTTYFGCMISAAPGGRGGAGRGGGMLLGAGTELVNNTVADNRALGGEGGQGGLGAASKDNWGAIVSRELGGAGGPGGEGAGGGLWVQGGPVRVAHATCVANAARGGSGGAGGLGAADAPEWTGPVGLSGNSLGGGIGALGRPASLINSIIAGSLSGGNLVGTIQDLGHNLSSDSSFDLVGPGSRINLDPLLGSLGNYGGPTPTVPLLRDSPALDATGTGTEVCPAHDQRGVARPIGAACDIGAYEGEPLALPIATLNAATPDAPVGQEIRIDLDLHNPNPTITLSNLAGRLELPADLIQVSGPPVLSLAALGPGQRYQTNVIVRVVRPGHQVVSVLTVSSLAGPRTSVSVQPLQGKAPPEWVAGWMRWLPDGTARLEALVIPNATGASAWFEYGPGSTPTFRTEVQPLPSGARAIPIQALLPLTAMPVEMRFRTVVSNDLGITKSPLAVLFPPRTLAACTPAELTEAVGAGGYVRLPCTGVIDLTETLVIRGNLVLDATGHDFAISGRNRVRIFDVLPGAELTLIHLGVIDGVATDAGGGLRNSNGVVRVLDSVLRNNQALGNPGVAGGEGRPAQGGAIFNRGVVYLENSRLEQNSVRGGDGWLNTNLPSSQPPMTAAGSASGGAIHHEDGTLVVRQVTLQANRATGGKGNPGGLARGGAIAQAAGRLEISGSSLNTNAAVGGTGGDGAVRDVNSGGGSAGGEGGDACGGAIDSHALLDLTGVLLNSNSATGGAGGAGGVTTVSVKVVTAHPPGAGGDARGGGCFASDEVRVQNCTVTANAAMPGASGLWAEPNRPPTSSGSPWVAAGLGGGFYQEIRASGAGAASWMRHTTLHGNRSGAGANVAIASGRLFLANGILAGTEPLATGYGPVIDLGGNLISDRSLGLPAVGRRSWVEPRLLPLADNGGPTWTMALAPDSPALDAANPGLALTQDQRGFPRPSGAGTDIGAYEFQVSPPAPSASAWLRADGAVGMRFVVWPNQSVVLEATTDWTTWTGILTNRTDAAGVFEAMDDQVSRHAWRMFRVRKE